MNNEFKVRQSTTSVVLGKAKVINYKDLKEIQTKRIKKEATKKTKSKKRHNRKYKNTIIKLNTSKLKTKITRINETLNLIIVLVA